MELCSFPAIYLGPNYGGGNEDNCDLFQKIPSKYCYTHCPQPCSRPPPTYASTGDPWTFLGKSGSISCGVTAPFSWVLVCTRFFCVCALQESVSQFYVSSGCSVVGLMPTFSKRAYAIPRSTATRAPALQQSTADPYLHRRHSNTVLSQSLWSQLSLLVSTIFQSLLKFMSIE